MDGWIIKFCTDNQTCCSGHHTSLARVAGAGVLWRIKNLGKGQTPGHIIPPGIIPPHKILSGRTKSPMLEQNRERQKKPLNTNAPREVIIVSPSPLLSDDALTSASCPRVYDCILGVINYPDE